MFPRMLLHADVCHVFVRVIHKLGESAVIDDKLPGLYLLLVHQDKMVSYWLREGGGGGGGNTFYSIYCFSNLSSDPSPVFI